MAASGEARPQTIRAPHERAAPESADGEAVLALKRELIVAQDHLADLEARFARLKPLLQAMAAAGFALRLARGAILAALAALALLWRWPAALKAVRDARLRAERFAPDAQGESYVKRLDARVFVRNLARAGHFAAAPPYRIRLRQRIGLADRPRVLHALANVWVGGSTQLVVDLYDYLGHRIEMETVTSSLPPQGAPAGMPTTLIPQPASRHAARSVFARFRPHLAHIHYWGDVDEAWYRIIFETAAEFGVPVVQNVNTPVEPFCATPVARNVFVSQSVLDRFGSKAPALVIHPGVDLDFFASRPVESMAAFNAIGMIYRLETDKLGPSAIELFIAVVKRRPATRAIIIGDGALFAPFRARVAEAGLSQNFEFAGAVPYEELPRHLARFRIFVAPVRQESFGQVIPFAMSAGLAVAGFRVGAVPEILGSDETLADTIEESAAIIAALLDDQKRIMTLGRRNRSIARERFSVTAMAGAYGALYEEVAPQPFDLTPGLPQPQVFAL